MASESKKAASAEEAEQTELEGGSYEVLKNRLGEQARQLAKKEKLCGA